MPEVLNYLQHWCKGIPSQAAIKVATLLDKWRGIHHFEDSLMRKVNWERDDLVTIRIRSDIATYDFSDLTVLVFLAHDHCIRVAIHPCNGQYLTITFHPRVREGDISQRHPTLEESVSKWRMNHQEVVK